MTEEREYCSLYLLSLRCSAHRAIQVDTKPPSNGQVIWGNHVLRGKGRFQLSGGGGVSWKRQMCRMVG